MHGPVKPQRADCGQVQIFGFHIIHARIRAYNKRPVYDLKEKQHEEKKRYYRINY